MGDCDCVLGERIRTARKQRKIGQEGLAEFIGIDRATLANYERGRTRVSAIRLIEIATCLDFPITFFTEGVVVTVVRACTDPRD